MTVQIKKLHFGEINGPNQVMFLLSSETKI